MQSLNAKHFTAEKVFKKGNSFNNCCSHGTVKLKAIPDFPDNLNYSFNFVYYLKIIIKKVKHFFERIQNYNRPFSFVSFNANVVDMPTIGRA